jgi:outer membrane lipoprotein-sorting protein
MVSIRGLALGFFLTTLLPAAEMAPSEMARFNARFEAKQSATTTFRAELLQFLKLSGLRDPVLSRGEILYRAPDQLLLRYTQPAGESILLHGNEVYVVKPPAPSRHVHLEPGKPGSEMLYFLGLFQDGGRKIREDWNFSASSESATTTVSLKPRSPLAEVLEIISQVRTRDLEIRSIQVRLPRNTTMTYEFQNIQRNIDLPATLFQPPS